MVISGEKNMQWIEKSELGFISGGSMVVEHLRKYRDDKNQLIEDLDKLHFTITPKGTGMFTLVHTITKNKFTTEHSSCHMFEIFPENVKLMVDYVLKLSTEKPEFYNG